MGKSIRDSLKNLFLQHRIVFWHDNKNEMHEDFKQIKIKDVENIEICNNEFSVKYKVLSQYPQNQG